MVKWKESWDLTTIPEPEFVAERNRRIANSRSSPPTPKKMRPCPYCSKEFGARDLRAHIPRCPQKT